MRLPPSLPGSRATATGVGGGRSSFLRAAGRQQARGVCSHPTSTQQRAAEVQAALQRRGCCGCTAWRGGSQLLSCLCIAAGCSMRGREGVTTLGFVGAPACTRRRRAPARAACRGARKPAGTQHQAARAGALILFVPPCKHHALPQSQFAAVAVPPARCLGRVRPRSSSMRVMQAHYHLNHYSVPLLGSLLRFRGDPTRRGGQRTRITPATGCSSVLQAAAKHGASLGRRGGLQLRAGRPTGARALAPAPAARRRHGAPRPASAQAAAHEMHGPRAGRSGAASSAGWCQACAWSYMQQRLRCAPRHPDARPCSSSTPLPGQPPARHPTQPTLGAQRTCRPQLHGEAAPSPAACLRVRPHRAPCGGLQPRLPVSCQRLCGPPVAALAQETG